MHSNILTSNKCVYNNNELEEYIRNISLGDGNSLSKLYEITGSAVYGFALSYLKNIHEVEDVLHDVYIKIYDNASSYQCNGKPMAWIFTITRNLSLMKLRSKKHYDDINEIIEIVPSKSNINDFENKLLIEAIFKCITDEERNILMLHIMSGYKHREISKLLDIPLSTVLSKYNRTIKKIKKYMGEEVNIWKRKI